MNSDNRNLGISSTYECGREKRGVIVGVDDGDDGGAGGRQPLALHVSRFDDQFVFWLNLMDTEHEQRCLSWTGNAGILKYIARYLSVQSRCLHTDHPTRWVYSKHVSFARPGMLSRDLVSDYSVGGVRIILVLCCHLYDGVS